MAHTQKLITKFNLDRKNKRFKPHNGSLCVFRPRPQPRIRIVLNALSGVEKNKAATKPITGGLCTSRYFRIRSSPVSYRTINQYGGTVLFPYRVNSLYYRMRVDRPIRFEYATCRRGNF